MVRMFRLASRFRAAAPARFYRSACGAHRRAAHATARRGSDAQALARSSDGVAHRAGTWVHSVERCQRNGYKLQAAYNGVSRSVWRSSKTGAISGGV